MRTSPLIPKGWTVSLPTTIAFASEAMAVPIAPAAARYVANRASKRDTFFEDFALYFTFIGTPQAITSCCAVSDDRNPMALVAIIRKVLHFTSFSCGLFAIFVEFADK